MSDTNPKNPAGRPPSSAGGSRPSFVPPPAYSYPPAPTGIGPTNPYMQRGPKNAGKKVLFGVLAAVLVIALVVIGLVAFWPRQQSAEPAGPSGAGSTTAAAPGSATSVVVTDTAIQVGRQDAPVVVQVFLDYMCPYCGQFERANGASLTALVTSGDIRLDLHVMSFLDQSSSTQYSTRAANAIVTVAKQSPEHLLDFHNALFQSQPSEGSAGLSDDLLASLAEKAGVPSSVAGTFSAHSNAAWVQQATQADFNAGITGTPTILINGTQFTGDAYTQGAIEQAIATAAGGSPTAAPTK